MGRPVIGRSTALGAMSLVLLTGSSAFASIPAATSVSTSCTAPMTANAGVPWACSAYPNVPVRANAVAHASETALIRAVAGAILNIDEYSEPVSYAASTTPLRKVNCQTYACVGGTAAPVTGKEWVASGSDGQTIVVDTSRRKSYEFWQAATDADGTLKLNADGSISASSMSVVDLDGAGNKTREGRNLNITGAGVSRMFGLIRAHEIRNAATRPDTAIPHALSVSLPGGLNCSHGFRLPATKTDGLASSNCIQEGARFQLSPTYNCSTLPKKISQAVCAALQKYGAYDMDNNGSASMIVYGQHRRSWTSANADYAAVGIRDDYSSLGLPMQQIRSLATWNG